MTNQEFITKVAEYVKKYAPNYNIKVYSPIIAQACLESAYGTSELATKANNFFGLKYNPSQPKRCPSANGYYVKVGSEQNANGSYTSSTMLWQKFDTMEQGIKGYFEFLNYATRYNNIKGVTDPQQYLTNLKADGYATSINYVSNNMAVISKWNLTKYDTSTTSVETQEEVTTVGSISLGMLNETVNGIKINCSYPANSGNYNSKVSRDVKYVVIHYTGNAKDCAINNAKYFQTGGRNASAHFFVDDSNIYQSVNIRDRAWHVGCSKGYKTACRNDNAVGIEMCCTSGNYIVSEKTQINAAYLCALLCKKLGITASQVDTYVLRHYDVVASNKACPRQFVTDATQWVRFKVWVKNILNGKTYNNTTETTTQTSVATTSTTTTSSSFLVQILVDDLNIRKGPGTNYEKNGTVNKGIKYTIVQTSGNWGKLKSGVGWISLNAKYVKRV